MIIYKCTSQTTSLSYIGKTVKTFEERFVIHVRESNNNSPYQFHEAIRTYGEDDFEITILESGDFTSDEFNQLEQYYIDKHTTYENGYNMTLGGDGGTTPEAVAKMLITRGTPDKNGVSSYDKGGAKTLKTKQDRIMPSGKTLLQETVEKTAQTRRERGDYENMSKNLMGIGIGSKKTTCEYCGYITNSGNYTRWHGVNCKLNPNITKEQLNKRIPHNKKERI